jgi:hypothetical protein
VTENLLRIEIKNQWVGHAASGVELGDLQSLFAGEMQVSTSTDQQGNCELPDGDLDAAIHTFYSI